MGVRRKRTVVRSHHVQELEVSRNDTAIIAHIHVWGSYKPRAVLLLISGLH